MEAFEYEQDTATEATGGELQDRARARYRARLGMSAKVVSRASATIAINTNGADPRSGNQTLGSGNDFDKDEFRVDLAYATLSPFADGVLPGVQNGYLAFDVGKVKNPFVWKALASTTCCSTTTSIPRARTCASRAAPVRSRCSPTAAST
jgi:hypothetical protein